MRRSKLSNPEGSQNVIKVNVANVGQFFNSREESQATDANPVNEDNKSDTFGQHLLPSRVGGIRPLDVLAAQTLPWTLIMDHPVAA